MTASPAAANPEAEPVAEKDSPQPAEKASPGPFDHHGHGHGHSDHKKKIKDLEDALEKSRKDYEEMLETARRMKAEYENYRKRTETQFFDRVDTEKAGLLKDYLTVLDDVERALAHLKPESGFEEWRKGMDLVLGRFRKLIEANGIETIHPLNEDFDPNLHEALMMEEKPDLDRETVTEVFEKGYRLNNRVIRHAKVRVAKPADGKKETQESNGGNS
jgi:molecular chaperone GrpE